MCGGRGSRLDAGVEKPLFQVGGVAMVDHVLDALADSRVGAVVAVVSPHVPRTSDHLSVPTIEAPGEGYVPDLAYALERVEGPVLTVAADLPLLEGDAVDAVLDAHEERTTARAGDESTAVCVSAALKRVIGCDVGEAFEHGGRELSPAGINVVADGEDAVHVTNDVRLAINVNRRSDATVAEGLL